MKITLEWSVDEKSLQRTMKALEHRLQRGAKKGLDDTLAKGKSTAKTTIDANRNPFTQPHLADEQSFRTVVTEPGNNHIYGVIRNVRDYAAYVDKGVSGVKNPRPTPFSFDNSKPPVQKLIPWVKMHLSGWSIDTDPDPFDTGSTGGGSSGDLGEDPPYGYHRPLADYDVNSDEFRKTRIENSNGLVVGMEIVFDNGDNTFEATIKEKYDDRVVVEYNIDFTKTIYLSGDSKDDIIARQKEAHFRELERGDEIIAYNTFQDDLDRPIYGEIERFTKDQYGLITGAVINDYFADEFDNQYTISYQEFRGLRNEYPSEWADEVKLATTVDSTPERFVEPDVIDNTLFNRYLKRSSGEVLIEDDGKIYLGNFKYSKKIDYKYKIDAGVDENGDRVTWRFNEPEDIENADWKLKGVTERVNSWQNIEEGQQIFVDVENYPDNDRWGIGPQTENTIIRAKVKNIYRKDDSITNKVGFVTDSAPSKGGFVDLSSANKAKFVGTRENNPGMWDARNTQRGDIVEFANSQGEKRTGRYLGNDDPRDERDNTYNLGSINVYDFESNINTRVKAEKVISVQKKPDFRDYEDPPDNFELPSEFKEYRHDSIENDPVDDAHYYAWSYQEKEFITVESAIGLGKFEKVGTDGSPYSTKYKARSEHAYPISIVGANETHFAAKKSVGATATDNIDVEEEIAEDSNNNLDNVAISKIKKQIEENLKYNLEDYEKVEDRVAKWKGSSDPGLSVDKIANGIKQVNGIEGEVRGNEVSLESKYIEGITLFTEITEEIINELGKGDKISQVGVHKTTLHRGLNEFETGALTSSFFDNPTADTHTIDSNIVFSYSFSEKHKMSDGVHHTDDINNERIIGLPDALFAQQGFRSEEEVWVAGGDNIEFNTEDLEIGNGAKKEQYNYEDLIEIKDFINSNFEKVTPSKIREYGLMISRVYEGDKSVNTVKGAERVEKVWEAIQKSDTIDNDIVLPPKLERDTDEPQDIIDGVTEGAYQEIDFKSEYSQQIPVRTGTLSEFGFKKGVSSGDMDVKVLPSYDPDTNPKDGLAIETDYSSEGADNELGLREVTTFLFADEIAPNTVSDHAADSESLDWVAKEVTNGKEVSEIAENSILLDQVDESQFYEGAAAQLLSGNFDAHTDNVYVTVHGDIQFIDLDHGAGDMSSLETGSKTWYDDALDRALGELAENAPTLTDDSKSTSKEKMKQKATEIAKTYYDTSDQTFSNEWELQIKPKLQQYEEFANVSVVENLEQNIKMFAEENY